MTIKSTGPMVFLLQKRLLLDDSLLLFVCTDHKEGEDGNDHCRDHPTNDRHPECIISVLANKSAFGDKGSKEIDKESKHVANRKLQADAAKEPLLALDLRVHGADGREARRCEQVEHQIGQCGNGSDSEYGYPSDAFWSHT